MGEVGEEPALDPQIEQLKPGAPVGPVRPVDSASVSIPLLRGTSQVGFGFHFPWLHFSAVFHVFILENHRW